jgi:hypothetical protein
MNKKSLAQMMLKFSAAAILSVVVFAPQKSFSQLSIKDAFSSRELVWYGLDFTKAKFIGKTDQAFDIKPVNEFELVNNYIPGWNNLVAMEQNNFNLRTAFWRNDVYYDLEPVKKHNAEIQPEGIMTYNRHTITKEDVENVVSTLKSGEKKEGIGLIFVVECFDKGAMLGSYWVTFFDIQTKKILFTERCAGTPKGFGLRNFWAGSIKQVLAEIREYKYKNWKKNASA